MQQNDNCCNWAIIANLIALLALFNQNYRANEDTKSWISALRADQDMFSRPLVAFHPGRTKVSNANVSSAFKPLPDADRLKLENIGDNTALNVRFSWWVDYTHAMKDGQETVNHSYRPLSERRADLPFNLRAGDHTHVAPLPDFMGVRVVGEGASFKSMSGKISIECENVSGVKYVILQEFRLTSVQGGAILELGKVTVQPRLPIHGEEK